MWPYCGQKWPFCLECDQLDCIFRNWLPFLPKVLGLGLCNRLHFTTFGQNVAKMAILSCVATNKTAFLELVPPFYTE